MTIDFYYVLASPPCRSVLLTAKAVGVQLNEIFTNLLQGEHMKPEFLKMNPQHAVPVLNDNGFVLTESRAMMMYLVDQYAKDDSLYPKDPKKRALVNQRIFFDMGTLYQRYLEYYAGVMWEGKAPDPEKLKKLEEGFQYLDKYLEGKSWVAGDNMTIADIDILTTVTSAVNFDFDVSKYPNIVTWLEKAKKVVPGYKEINQEGLIQYRPTLGYANSQEEMIVHLTRISLLRQFQKTSGEFVLTCFSSTEGQLAIRAAALTTLK